MSEGKRGIVRDLKSGFFKGVGLAAGFLTTSIFAAAAAMNIFGAGEVISAAKINQNFAIAAPEGAVVAFFLTECPEGWAPADGTNATPDLRGRFVRGRDDVGTGAAGKDPSGVRAVGSEQGDAFQGHKHDASWIGNLFTANGNQAMQTGFGMAWAGITGVSISGATDDGHGSPQVSTETRPLNVALTYCMRKN